MLKHLPILLAVIIIISAGCNSGSGDPVSPTTSDQQTTGITEDLRSGESEASRRYLWGLYIFIYDQETNTCEVVPVRQAADHYNVLFWLETWPCTNCVRVTEANPTTHDSIDFTVRITHPFTNLNFTGFDVRGIALFDQGREFPEMNHELPDAGAGTGELLNADGYTSLYAWWTASYGGPEIQTYIPGRFATPEIPNASLNGYRNFISDNPDNTRRAFIAGDVIEQSFDIDMPDGDLVFGYAVDASWVQPTTRPVTDPMTDFPPEANCAEPYLVDIEVDPIGPGLNLGGGATELIIDVYDHVVGSHEAPEVECPELISGIMTATLEKEYEDYSRYRAVISNVDNPSPIEGTFRCLVSVRDETYGDTDAWIEAASYAVADVEVVDTSHSGWARTWGSPTTDSCAAVAADLNGNVYVGGYFNGTVDFDPGDDIDEYTAAADSSDAFLTRYDSQGNYQWTKVWGGGGTDGVSDIAIDARGDIIVVGQWEAGIDFDPDPDEQWLDMTVGDPEGFISKFNVTGDFLWAQKIWGHGYEIANGVDTDLSSNIYVTGVYEDNASLDRNENDHFPSNGLRDAFIAKYGSNGTYIFGQTLGSTGYDYGYRVATGGNDYVAWVGAFNENDGGGGVDFNPNESLTDMHFSNGSLDVFIIRYHPSGNYEYGVSFGDIGADYADDTAVSGSYIYACGIYQSEVDFNPGPGFDVHTAVGDYDCWAARYNDELIFLWADTWGGTDTDEAKSIAVDSYGGVYVAGNFRDIVDFDPGIDEDNHTTEGFMDAYLLKLSTSGDYQWVRTLGSSDTERGTDVAIGEYAFPYMVGTFTFTVDFSPPTIPYEPHTSNGQWDPFLIKYLLNGEW